MTIDTKKTTLTMTIMLFILAISSTVFATSFGIQTGDLPDWYYDSGVYYDNAEPYLQDATKTYDLNNANALDTKVFVAYYYTKTDSVDPNNWPYEFSSGFDWTTYPSSSYYNYDNFQNLYTSGSQNYGYGWELVEITGNPGEVTVFLQNNSDYYPDSLVTEYHIAILQENAPVPEPATMLLLGSGLVGLAGFRSKFRKN